MEKGFRAVVKRELQQILQNRSFLLGVTAMPILCLIFLLTLFGSSTLHDFPVAVVDGDNSAISRQFKRMVNSTAGVEVKYMPQSMGEAQELLLEGKVGAVLYIPQNMEKDIYTATTVTPVLYVNAMKLLNGSLIFKDISTSAQMLSVGIEMQLLTSGGSSPLEASNLALPVYYEKHLMFNPYTSYGYYLQTPFNTLMILVFAALSTLFSVGLEQKKSTATQWLERANGSPYIALLGKAIPYTIFYSLFAMLSNFIIYGYMETPMAGCIWTMTLNSVLCIIAYQSAALIIFVVIRKLMVALSISAALTTMSFTMAGLTFPLIAMHKPILYFAHLFPYTYFIYAYVDITRGASPLYSLPYISVMLIYPIIAIFVAPQVVKLAQKPNVDKLF